MIRKEIRIKYSRDAMSNIYEALQDSDQALQHQGTMEQEMIHLYRQIDALLPDLANMVLQFISSRYDDGVLTIVREYASMAATMREIGAHTRCESEPA